MTTSTITANPRPGTVDPVLDQLLDDELAYDPVADRGFINHLAMSLVAARRLGATDDDLREAFRSQTSGRFLLRRDRPAWLDDDARDAAVRGAAVVAGEQLPSLVSSPSSQFFHAPIRLELALDADHPGQVANALHNWAGHNTAIEPPPAATPDGDRTYLEVLAELRRDLGGGSVHAGDDAFRQTFDRLAVTDALLDEVAAAVAAMHAAEDSFLTLHLVTGTRAERALAPLLDIATRTDFAVRTAHAVALTWLGSGEPALAAADTLDGHRGETPHDWDEIGRRAIETGDPHVVKLAYACRLEHDTTGDPIYPWLAARQAGMT